MAQNGNKRAETRLYEAFHPLAVWKIENAFPDLDTETQQQAAEWAMLAIGYALKTFDPNKRVKLATYVGRCVCWYALAKVIDRQRNDHYDFLNTLRETDPQHTLAGRTADQNTLGWEDRIHQGMICEEIYEALTPRASRACRMLYSERKSCRETANALGVARQRVYQLIGDGRRVALPLLAEKGITATAC